jgi:ATP-dependent Lhr-like helicase
VQDRPPWEKGIWSAIYPALLAEIRAHRSSILFVNSRGLCERLCQRLNELAGEELVRAHHGSVSHEQRAEIEEGLKAGTIRAIVATSSLEMGIDMGAVDRGLLVESPGSVARGLQRVGRAGHGVGEVSSGRIFPKFRDDLLECALVARRMLEGEIESFRMPRNALDVLAQQVRDALGLVPPPELQDAYIGPTEAPLEHLLRRFARTHGPFSTGDAADRFGLRPAQAEPVLRLLEVQAVLVRGEIRPLGVEPEWCDAEVLRRLRRRTLARLRDAVAPVDAATLGRFLPAWQGVGEQIDGPDRLMEAVLQLEGLTASWSQLDRVLLPARVPGYRSADLDLLAATGRVVWVGLGSLGFRDGRVALYRRERISELYGRDAVEA